MLPPAVSCLYSVISLRRAVALLDPLPVIVEEAMVVTSKDAVKV